MWEVSGPDGDIQSLCCLKTWRKSFTVLYVVRSSCVGSHLFTPDEDKKANHTKKKQFCIGLLKSNWILPAWGDILVLHHPLKKGKENSAYENNRAGTILLQSGETHTFNTLVSQFEYQLRLTVKANGLAASLEPRLCLEETNTITAVVIRYILPLSPHITVISSLFCFFFLQKAIRRMCKSKSLLGNLQTYVQKLFTLPMSTV